MELGIAYDDDRWPHGLRCGDCHRVLGSGDRYSEQLVGVTDDMPVLRIVCVVCALST